VRPLPDLCQRRRGLDPTSSTRGEGGQSNAPEEGEEEALCDGRCVPWEGKEGLGWSFDRD